jgi:cell division protein FtsL
MARKKKDNGSIFLVVIIVILVLIAIATPIVLLAGYIYKNFKSSKVKSTLEGNESDFWLNDAEKNSFKTRFNEFSQVSQLIEDANQKGENEGVSRNQDGQFSARSKLGKEIRSVLETNIPKKEMLGDFLQC